MDNLPEWLEEWTDSWFDREVGLLWNPVGSFEDEAVDAHSVHLLPQSGWYALLLASRGDTENLPTVLDAILERQLQSPGKVWDGTFTKFGETPVPGPDAVEWVDYDPNWRQFLGTSLALLLRTHRTLLPPTVADRVEDAVRYAVASEPDGRLDWHYTNIALKQAWLQVEYGNADRGLELATDIYEHWKQFDSFPEFNSPTYDGVDLWALALWRGHSAHPDIKAWGAEMEAGLWRTIANRYHAGLGNSAGPFGRAYGLDMERYCAKTAMYIRLAGGSAPVPRPDGSVAHTHDLFSAPGATTAASLVPEDALAHLQAFQGERFIEDVITTSPTRRQATAWLSETLMVGGEHGDSNWSGWSQFVAGTAHWRHPSGEVMVLRVVPDEAPKLRAEPGMLRSDEKIMVEVHAPAAGHRHSTVYGVGAPGVTMLREGTTKLPGATVELVPDRSGHVLAVHPTG